MSRTKATTCKWCDAPRNTRAGSAGSLALCEDHLRQYWRERDATRAPRRKALVVTAEPASRRVRVVVTGDRVTMDLVTFQRLMARQAPAPEPARPVMRRLVNEALTQVVIYEAGAAREVMRLDDGRYAVQLTALREAGYHVCVEG